MCNKREDISPVLQCVANIFAEDIFPDLQTVPPDMTGCWCEIGPPGMVVLLL